MVDQAWLAPLDGEYLCVAVHPLLDLADRLTAADADGWRYVDTVYSDDAAVVLLHRDRRG